MRQGEEADMQEGHLEERHCQEAGKLGLSVELGDLVIVSLGEVEVLVDTVPRLVHEPEIEHGVGVVHVSSHLVVERRISFVGSQPTHSVVVHVAHLPTPVSRNPTTAGGYPHLQVPIGISQHSTLAIETQGSAGREHRGEDEGKGRRGGTHLASQEAVYAFSISSTVSKTNSVEFHWVAFKKAPRSEEPLLEMDLRGMGHIPLARMKAALAYRRKEGKEGGGGGEKETDSGAPEQTLHPWWRAASTS
jgi:hypothetical protein